MNFKPELVEKILAGQKTVTRRLRVGGKLCQYKEGKDYALCPGRGKNQVARILVSSVDAQELGDISSDDARLEGFDDDRHFMRYWVGLYGEFDETLPVWRIEFELIERENK